MTRALGTTARGIRAPIIKEGDYLPNIVVDSLLSAVESEGFTLNDKDVVAVTESLVARAQGNYVTLEDIAEDINRKFEGDIALMFPILSRNRFSVILKALALTGKKIHLFLSYPSDEVGNHLMDIDKMDELDVNPYKDLLTEEKYRELFGENVEHTFTGIDYVKMYKEISENISIYLANDPREALKYTKEILVANIHERHRTKRILKNAGAKTVYGLDDILTESINGSGYNSDYGLLGSNKATDDKVKLFPRDSREFVMKVQEIIKEKTGKNLEVMVYGDGAFKDPIGKIWELADPVVSPGFTDGLLGTPNEIKLKYIADNDLKDMTSSEMVEKMKEKINEKGNKAVAGNEALGTTPRQITDLLGSLCDLISGSGDKGTPIVLVQGYFDNYATE
ncbi:coenzyme F420-0:L-glutamate ligase [Clostridium sp. MSJ-4]|uniref:Coenzyme F420-0:L-glutamate ligase n=1 Tax=Clostridium simiarum TaxID=2841506 RepID=A0ABS6EY58_9CLOT|nr:coenzyme F420-0:L-glutamate ligase [Clostridium simiarum]MBU5591164.1 coenzyme F420-0:L-glutamate ligase [Clostridium simiarum]